MKDKTIILGVTGSIAAYKAADLTSMLVQAGADVRVVMTEAATRIVAPITLQTLSRNPVAVDIWEEENGWQPGHIDLADSADLLAVVPATANTMASFAHGLAPNLLCNIYLATQAPVLIAPAMNGKMLAHPRVCWPADTKGRVSLHRSRRYSSESGKSCPEGDEQPAAIPVNRAKR